MPEPTPDLEDIKRQIEIVRVARDRGDEYLYVLLDPDTAEAAVAALERTAEPEGVERRFPPTRKELIETSRSFAEQFREARQQRDALAQAMWEARRILGFDNDGDATPGARIAGMGWEGFRQSFLRDMEEQRQAYEECIEEIKLPGDIRAAKEEERG